MAKNEELALQIDGMHCASCVSIVEKGVLQLEGVNECRVNLAMGSATVAIVDNQLTIEDVIKKIDALGYTASKGRPDILVTNQKEMAEAKQNMSMALLFAIPLMVIAMSPIFFDKLIFGVLYNALIQAVIAGIVLFYSGRSIIVDAIKQTFHFRANMNSLIAMGTMTAYCWSLFGVYKIYTGFSELLYFDSASMIISLILIGRFLEAKSKGKAGEAIKALLNLTPSKALALINDVEIEIDAATVQTGMTLIVRPGERIPADGTIVENNPYIDESMLTGESLPVEKKNGDAVFGGSLNGTIPFKMTVTASGDKTFLASIIRLVSDAQSKKAPVQKLADKVASVFVPIVLGIALITFVSWYLLAPDSPMMIRSIIAVLIIACPCSLGLATPTAILAGTGRAAKEGIIIRGGDILEKITKVDSIIFDKTGTLTHGKLEVAEVKTFGKMTTQNLIAIVAAAETQSEHPVAKAIVKYSKIVQTEPVQVKKVEAFPGIGIKAEYNNRLLLVGNKKLMEIEQVNFGQATLAAEAEMDKGRTVVYVAIDNQIVGLLALADKVRSEALDVISHLKTLVKEVTMLSGDTRTTAGGVARSIGIDNFEAEIRPEQKQKIVQSLKKAGYTIAMVGDGINDAPALAEANVGIAIGSGTDIAIESSDVVLVRTELHSIIKLFTLSHFSLKIIKQNLFWAFIYNILAIPIAAGLFYPLFGWSLSPMIAAAAMSFSSIFVVTNSLRLNKIDLS